MTPLPLCVLPVLDLQHGQVVQARAGRRHLYQPLTSVWCSQASDAVELTTALTRQFHFHDYYLADLDALAGSPVQYSILQELIRAGQQLWLDAGITTLAAAQACLDAGVHRLIIAGETLPDLKTLRTLATRLPVERLIFSLDLFEGRVRSQPTLENMDMFELVEAVVTAGIHQLIVLDTAAVGLAEGPVTLPLCRQLRQRYPHLHLISGGGVRHREDISQFLEAGVNRVLVSTWLHRGCP